MQMTCNRRHLSIHEYVYTSMYIYIYIYMHAFDMPIQLLSSFVSVIYATFGLDHFIKSSHIHRYTTCTACCAQTRQFIWALIKIKVPGKGTIADQSRINRDPKGDNRGGILFFPMSCVQKIKALFSYT